MMQKHADECKFWIAFITSILFSLCLGKKKCLARSRSPRTCRKIEYETNGPTIGSVFNLGKYRYAKYKTNLNYFVPKKKKRNRHNVFNLSSGGKCHVNCKFLSDDLSSLANATSLQRDHKIEVSSGFDHRSCGWGNMTFLICHVTTWSMCHVTLWEGLTHPKSPPW